MTTSRKFLIFFLLFIMAGACINLAQVLSSKHKPELHIWVLFLDVLCLLFLIIAAVVVFIRGPKNRRTNFLQKLEDPKLDRDL